MKNLYREISTYLTTLSALVLESLYNNEEGDTKFKVYMLASETLVRLAKMELEEEILKNLFEYTKKGVEQMNIKQIRRASKASINIKALQTATGIVDKRIKNIETLEARAAKKSIDVTNKDSTKPAAPIQLEKQTSPSAINDARTNTVEQNAKPNESAAKHPIMA